MLSVFQELQRGHSDWSQVTEAQRDGSWCMCVCLCVCVLGEKQITKSLVARGITFYFIQSMKGHKNQNTKHQGQYYVCLLPFSPSVPIAKNFFHARERNTCPVWQALWHWGHKEIAAPQA